MRKNQNRAIIRAKARATAKQRQAKDRASSQPPAQAQPPRREWPSWLGWLFRPIALLWALGLAMLNLIQAGVPYLPHISIQASINLNFKDPLATQFVFTNTGILPVYDLKFGCIIDPGNSIVREAEPGQEPVATLAAGAPVTRDCAFRSFLDPRGQTPFLMILSKPAQTVLRPFVEFTWPIIGRKDRVEARYTSKPNRDTGGYSLVPNASDP